MNAARPWILSYDVGGSHATAGLVHQVTLDLQNVRSRRIDSAAAAEGVLDALAELGIDALAGQPQSVVSGIAMSMPGPFDYQKGICYIRGLAKYEQLYGVDFRATMAQRFPEVPREEVRFINDAAAALLGEIHAGAAKGAHRVIGLTLGTGVGSAFAVGGRIVTNGPGVPPEGYVYNQPFRDGIAEDYVSGRVIKKMYASVSGSACEVKEIAQRAAHDATAKMVFCQFGQMLGEVLLLMVNGFRPDVIVLGGAVARSSALFLPATRGVLKDAEVELRPSSLNDSAGVIGAAVAWSQQ
jgi:glucokinase